MASRKNLLNRFMIGFIVGNPRHMRHTGATLIDWAVRMPADTPKRPGTMRQGEEPANR